MRVIGLLSRMFYVIQIKEVKEMNKNWTRMLSVSNLRDISLVWIILETVIDVGYFFKGIIRFWCLQGVDLHGWIIISHIS